MILKLLISFGGVFFSYLLNGIAIESITNTFGDKIFTFYLFMVFIPSIFNVVFAKLALVIKSYFIKEAENTYVILSKKSANNVPKKMYFLCAMFYVFSMLCSNASLAHINYPTQLVLKSSKPIPILFCGCFLSNKRYPLQRFASTWIIVSGVISFMYEQYRLNSQASVGTTPAEKFIGSSYVKGWGLVFASLGFDGMLAATQEHMRQSHELDTHLLMYHVNAYSSVFLGMALVGFNEFPGFFIFIKEHPSVLFYLLLLGLTSGLGQNFIYYTITTFGPLTCSVVTTTRKFFNVLLSVLIFSHVFSIKLWISVGIVFIGLVLDIWIPYSNKS